MRHTTVLSLMLATALTSMGTTLYWVTRAPAAAELALLDPVILVGQIQELARLETATVPLTTTVHGVRGQGWMRTAAGEELVFQGVGEARAGVDLASLDPGDVWIDGAGVVWIRLPEAEVFGVTLDEDRSQVLARQTGWFGRPDRSFETQARQAAVRQLEAQADVIGLREAAQDQAEVVIADLLQTLGAPAVRFAEPDTEASVL